MQKNIGVIKANTPERGKINMQKGYVIGAAALLFVYKVLRSINALKIRLQSYEISSVNVADGTVGMYLYFSINNPLWVGLTLREISGTLVSQSIDKVETIGTIYNRYNYFIRGNATHIIRAAVKVESKSVLAALVQNVQSGSVDNMLITFDGKLVFGGTREVALPIKKTMTIRELVGK